MPPCPAAAVRNIQPAAVEAAKAAHVKNYGAQAKEDLTHRLGGTAPTEKQVADESVAMHSKSLERWAGGGGGGGGLRVRAFPRPNT